MSGRFAHPLPMVSAAVCGMLFVQAVTTARSQRFTEITVERINLIEPDGTVRLVIANSAQSPRLMHRGEAFGPPPGGRPGLIFYNDEGTEADGLTFSGRTENGRTMAVGSLTFDQYERNQTIALQTVEAGGARRAGLSIADYPGPPTIDVMRKWDSIQALPEGDVRAAARRQFQAMTGMRVTPEQRD